MKAYIKPEYRIIDLYEEGEVLTSSNPNSVAFDVTDDYSDEEALSSKRNIWENTGIWKD